MLARSRLWQRSISLAPAFAVLITMMVGPKAFATMAEAIKLYDRRAEGAQGLRAPPAIIDRSLALLHQEIKVPAHLATAARFIMKGNYFKATFTGVSASAQEDLFAESRRLGEQAVAAFPQDVPLRYWYIISLGMWAETHGKIAAATDGIAEILKTHCEWLIKVAPAFDEGGGFRLLGRIHHQAPQVPLVLSWPSDDEAERLLRRARTYNPRNITTNLFLAEVLQDQGGHAREVKELLTLAAQAQPNPERLLEERADILKAQALLKAL